MEKSEKCEKSSVEMQGYGEKDVKVNVDVDSGNVSEKSTKIPLSSVFILGVEFCERLAYYAITTVLTMYTGHMLEISTVGVNAISNSFNTWGYECALIGGIIADSWLGKYKTILIMAWIYFVGLLVLTLSSLPFAYDDFPYEPNAWAYSGFAIALVFIGLGTGGVKSNVSTMVADQLKGASDELVESVFRWFYFMINAGALIGIFLAPILHHFGKEKTLSEETDPFSTSFYWSFMLPTIMFLLGIVLFVSGKKRYYVPTPTGSLVINSLRAGSEAIRNRRGTAKDKNHWLDWATGKNYDAIFIKDLKMVLKACRVFCVFPLYWLLYGQMQTNFVIQGTFMDRPSWMTADQLQLIDPLFLVILIPVFDKIVFPAMRKRGIVMSSIARITFGFALCATAFIIAGILQYEIADRGTWDTEGKYQIHEDKVPFSIWWQILPELFIAISEIFASVTALEFAYTQSPKTMKSVTMSLFLLTNAAGSLIGLSLTAVMKPQNYMVLFFSFAGAMYILAVIFHFVFRSHVLETLSSDEFNVPPLSDSSNNIVDDVTAAKALASASGAPNDTPRTARRESIISRMSRV